MDRAKIRRSPNYASGGLTDHERVLTAEHAKLWIARAMRTAPIEPDKITAAIHGLYAVAGLKRPRVVIVPSPLVMAFAYGAAAAIWKSRGAVTVVSAFDATLTRTNDTTHATRDSMNNATRKAMDEATYQDMRFFTLRAVVDATNAGTYETTSRAIEHDIKAMDATNAGTSRATAMDGAIRAMDAATYNATYRATHDVAGNAMGVATRDATSTALSKAMNATYKATYGPVARDVLRKVTYNATFDATHKAMDPATHNATYRATAMTVMGGLMENALLRNALQRTVRDACDAAEGAARACLDVAGRDGFQCASQWLSAYQGGNMWAAYDCHLTACRDILGLRLPEHDAYAYWEAAAIHGGFRVMHEEFCIVSDFPEVLRVDAQNRPHCETGPSHRWRDGWSLYHWHGTRVPPHWIEHRDTLDPNEVIQVENVEQRAAGAAIVGWPKMLSVLEARTIDKHPSDDIGELIELTLPGLPEPGRFLVARCPRNGLIVEGVPYVSDVDGLPIDTALAAQAWRVGDPLSEYIHPPRRT